MAHLYDAVVTSGTYQLLSVRMLRRAFLEVMLGGDGFPYGEHSGAAACLDAEGFRGVS